LSEEVGFGERRDGESTEVTLSLQLGGFYALVGFDMGSKLDAQSMGSSRHLACVLLEALEVDHRGGRWHCTEVMRH
jgi:hypothetical protein